MKPKPNKPHKKNGSKRAMTNRQRKLLEGLAAGKTQKQAAIDAGYSKAHPGKVANQTLNRMAIDWTEDLDAVFGQRREVLEKYLLPMMNARHTKASHDGKHWRYSKPLVAWGPRRDGLDIYCKIAGAYKMPEIGERGPIQVQVITNFTLPDPDLSGPNGHGKDDITLPQD